MPEISERKYLERSLSVCLVLAILLGSIFLAQDLGRAAEVKKSISKNVEAVADQLEYTKGNKKIIGKGNVVVTYGEVKLTSDYAEVETETKKAYARGHVMILRGDQLSARGEEVTYDFENDRAQFPNGKIVDWPWFAEGEKIDQLEKGKIKIEQGGVTTCDLERPHYQLRAKQVTIHTGDKMIARNVSLYILGRKVFWWPYLVIPLERFVESPFQIQPGYSSQNGAYILTSKGFSITKWLWGKWHADWRAKRGFAGGIDLGYSLEKLRTKGTVQSYLAFDQRAPNPALDNPYSDRVDRNRGRFTWKQRTDINPDTYALVRFHKANDEFLLQDFFQKEFRADIEPSSFVDVTHNSDRYGFYAFNQKRINRFESTTERLPEVRFDWKNAPFFSDRVYYEDLWSLSNLNQKYARSKVDDHVFRFDTFHEWTAPLQWNQIKLTPSGNIRETLYSRDRAESESQARTAFGGAVDLRTQFYRIFNTSTDFLGIDINQLRHVFEPSVRYDTVLESTVSNERLVKFDSTENIDDSNRVTFGLENRIQTKRMIDGKMKRVDLVSLNTFLSYDFHPDEEYSRSGFSIWSGEFQFRPYPWLQYETRYEYDMIRDKFRQFNQDLIARTGRYHILFGHRYVARSSYLNAEGNQQFVLDTGAWVNTRWAIGGYVRWNAEHNKLEEWQISATRDLHDFLLDFGYNVRNSLIDRSNKELFFLLRLKAFPAFPLKSGNRASFSEPRIGTTVAGANQAPSAFEAA